MEPGYSVLDSIALNMGSLFSKESSNRAYIFVKTGDVKGSGTDANVSIQLFSENGESTESIKLDQKFKNDFEQGQLDKFPVTLTEKMLEASAITKIEVSRDSWGAGDSWHLEKIVVVRKIREKGKAKGTVEEFVFPIHRWIKADKKYVFFRSGVFLPQDDPDPETRKLELQEARDYYQFTIKVEGLPSLIKCLPDDELFSFSYLWDIVGMKAKVVAKSKITGLTSSKWKRLEHLENIYSGNLNKPYSLTSRNWRDDKSFGLQRVMGCNPHLICLCTQIPDKFGVTNEMVSPFLEGKTLQETLQAKKIFIVDLKIVEGIPTTNGQITAPIVLFYLNNAGDLMPISIQLGQNKEDIVFLPSDPEYTWLNAKLWYNLSDASYHQTLSHLGFTHFAMESVCVAFHRCLSISHPIFKLLAPHFIYLIAINCRGLELLVAPGEWVDKCMSTGVKGMYALMAKGFEFWRMDLHGTLPKELESRGVLDPEVLPFYPFRDDALLLYGAIVKYVTAVITGHYTDAEKIAQDAELQDWRRTLDAKQPEGCGLKGIPGDGKFVNTDEIISCCTSIIYTCSVAHAATNFSQYDEYAFPLNYPPYLNGTPPKSKAPLTEQDIIDMLPTQERTMDIMAVTKLLSMKATKSLSDFEVRYMYDPIGDIAINEFKKELAEIEVTISQRNKKRVVPYPYLNPKSIPNAISI